MKLGNVDLQENMKTTKCENIKLEGKVKDLMLNVCELKISQEEFKIKINKLKQLLHLNYNTELKFQDLTEKLITSFKEKNNDLLNENSGKHLVIYKIKTNNYRLN